MGHEFLDSREAILAYLEAVFEDGDPELIALALNNVARAQAPHERRADCAKRHRRRHRNSEGARARAHRQGGVSIVQKHRHAMLEAWDEALVPTTRLPPSPPALRTLRARRLTFRSLR
jgi:hypothetical protein